MIRPCVRVPRARGEAARRDLVEAGLLDHAHAIDATDEAVFIPVVDPEGVPPTYDVVDHEVEPRETPTLPGDGLDFEPTYERLGDIVLLDEPDPDRAEAAAAAIMTADLPVRTVLNKASAVEGTERVREWTVLAGDGTETVHREYGCEFLVDVAAVYFSPRLATERHRVVEQVRPGERVLDMFAGVGPFAVPMAKRGAEVVAVDVNPAAVEYLRENAERNGIGGRLTAIAADVREAAADYPGWADRIVMNLPHSADEFLDVAVGLAGEDCTLHYYDIQPEEAPFDAGERAIRGAAGGTLEVTVVDERVVRSYAPGMLNVCLDVRLERR